MAICGGVVSQSMDREDPLAYMMCFVLPDKWYKKYKVLLKLKKWKEADDLVKKYGWSNI